MKPAVKKGPASHYESPRERIMEISSVEDGVLIGCLLSVMRVGERLVVNVYRADPGVIVHGPDAQVKP